LSFNKKNILRFFSHPLFLLVIGAIISSMIIPVYTNQWQNYQKELEIKSMLAEEISTSISNMIINSRLIQISGFTDDIDYTRSVIDWEVSKARISSIIGTYFTDPFVKNQLEGLSFLVDEFSVLETSLTINGSDYYNKLCLRYGHIINIYKYILNKNETFAQFNPINMNLTTSNKCPREEDKLFVNQYYNITPGSIDWNIMLHKELTHESDDQIKYRINWILLEKYIQQQKIDVIELLLRSELSGF
jgi:hypothetical protein